MSLEKIEARDPSVLQDGDSLAWMQTVATAWGVRAFGQAHMSSTAQRGVRFLEEAIELYQAVTDQMEPAAAQAMAHKLVDAIFAKPPGEVRQEIGGVGVTLLTLAAAIGTDTYGCFRDEIRRVLAKPAEHFAARNATKNAAGFDVTGGPCPTEAAR